MYMAIVSLSLHQTRKACKKYTYSIIVKNIYNLEVCFEVFIDKKGMHIACWQHNSEKSGGGGFFSVRKKGEKMCYIIRVRDRQTANFLSCFFPCALLFSRKKIV